MMDDFKLLIIRNLERLGKKEVADKEVWKARAYSNAIRELKAHDGPIRTLEDIKGIKGIGKKITDKIDEIIKTGKLQQAEIVEANPDFQIITELSHVHGVGPVKARELVEKHGIKSISQLKDNLHLLNEKQKLAIKYVDDFKSRIPRKEMERHENIIVTEIKRHFPNILVELVGSFRRRLKDSGDIDVLITDPISGSEISDDLLKSIVRVLTEKKYLKDTFALGNKKYLGVSKVRYAHHYRRLDLLVTHPHEFPFALLYFTGSQGFNVAMRNIALEHGYSLSEYGLKYASGPHKGEFVDTVFYTEKDIFDFLKMKYVAPEHREASAVC